MSLLPYDLDDMYQDLQHFSLGVPTSDLYSMPMHGGCLRPRRRLHYLKPKVSSVANDKDGFKVDVNVQKFKPQELNVKVVGDYAVIEGKHEERLDKDCLISRQFTRRYKLPKDIDAKALESKLSSDGVLQLHAPKLALANTKERSLPIIHTNQPALKPQPLAQSNAKVDNKNQPALKPQPLTQSNTKESNKNQLDLKPQPLAQSNTKESNKNQLDLKPQPLAQSNIKEGKKKERAAK